MLLLCCYSLCVPQFNVLPSKGEITREGNQEKLIYAAPIVPMPIDQIGLHEANQSDD